VALVIDEGTVLPDDVPDVVLRIEELSRGGKTARI
jgi:hypothetical protein